jgi:hypothetical protein
MLLPNYLVNALIKIFDLIGLLFNRPLDFSEMTVDPFINRLNYLVSIKSKAFFGLIEALKYW